MPRKTLAARVASLEKSLAAFKKQRRTVFDTATRNIDILDRRTQLGIASIGEVDERLSNRITEVESAGEKIALLRQDVDSHSKMFSPENYIVKTEMRNLHAAFRELGKHVAILELTCTCKRKKRKAK
jgi:hypothetical protein